jgi:hypothetical protein
MMNKVCFLFLLLFISSTLPAQPGSRINFNRDWKFKLGDYKGAEAVGYDDMQWDDIGLPHSFSTPYFMSPDFYVGYGWYRKNFNVPVSYKRKRLFIEFEGAFQDAEIFVNGKEAGTHKGGYTGFSIDISQAVIPGRNVIAVRLNNLWNARLTPRAGEHVFSGGIYRDVFLVPTNPVHITWNGTFVTTPKATVKTAIINLKTEIKNDDLKDHAVSLKTIIYNPDGKLEATLLSTKTISAGAALTFDQTSSQLVSPKLWHPKHPFIYRAVSTLIVGGKDGDKYETPFGIRSIKWTSDKGFFLNGEHYYLKGANVHQDHAGWGDAVTNKGIARDVQMVKDAGFNFIRGSHYPHDPAFANACDSLGVMFWSENAFWGIGGSARNPEGYWNTSAYPVNEADRNEFDESVKQQLTEMIRINRNHPSIIVWSMSNEPFFTARETISPMRNLLKHVVALTHQLDPTRPAAIGGSQRPLDSMRIDKLGDVAGYNGDGASISVFQNPGVPSLISEYGSTTADRPGKYEPGWADLLKDSGKEVYSWRSGQAIWCAFDHGSIAGTRLGKMGIIDYFRIPKRAWYWYRNEYKGIKPTPFPVSGTPARLKLEVDKSSKVRTDGTDDVKLLVTVLDASGTHITNSPPVELKVVSGPGEFPTGPSIKFEERGDIQILDGQAAIEFRSYYAGQTIIRATSPGLLPAEVKVQFTGLRAYVVGKVHEAKPHPYIRFNKKDHSHIPLQFGANNPTFTSSSLPEHPAGLAADGNRNTWWQPLENDESPSWTLDMERGVSVSNIKINFPAERAYQYKIELSENRIGWKEIADFMQNNLKENSTQVKLSSGLTGRYVRISFKSASNAQISEVEVIGTQSN